MGHVLGLIQATLRRRFRNEQHIVSKHMDALLILQLVTCHHDFKGLCRLCDSVEQNLKFMTTYSLKIDAYPTEQSLDELLRRFWHLNPLEIVKAVATSLGNSTGAGNGVAGVVHVNKDDVSFEVSYSFVSCNCDAV